MSWSVMLACRSLYTDARIKLKAKPFLTGFFLCLSLLITACASFPVQELSDARQALQAARAAHASERAPFEYQKALQLLEDADHAIDNGDYHRARRAARQARSMALQARHKSDSVSQ